MNRLGLCVALIGIAALPVHAAEITRIASSLEPDDPLGFFLDVGFDRTQVRGGIAREQHVGGVVRDVTELRYTLHDSRVQVGAQIGLYKDLEFRFHVPFVIGQDRVWNDAAGVDASNSSITNNCLGPNGALLDPNCLTNGTGARPLFNVPQRSYRGGIGNVSLGLAYAIFNQKKDDTKPMWLVGFDWELPTARRIDPTIITAANARGAIGDSVNKVALFTSFSRRMGVIDPYVRFAWSIPVQGPDFYSNCDHPSVGLSFPQNCGAADWPRTETGIRMPHVISVTFGTELVASEDKEADQRFALDVRGIANYVTEGRYYNALSDPLHKLLATGDYLELGGRFGVVAKPTRFFSLRGGASLLRVTDHTLTDEPIGKDSALDADKRVAIPQSTTADAPEVNPNFDFRTDMVSRRFRMVENYTFVVDVNLTFSF